MLSNVMNKVPKVYKTSTHEKFFKTMITGDGAVGKTALVTQFVDKRFITDHKATIGMSCLVKELEVFNKKVKLTIWDVEGQSQFSFVRPAYYSGSFGGHIVFSITNQVTFTNVFETRTMISYKKLKTIENLTSKEKQELYVGVDKGYKKVENLAGLAEGQKNELYVKYVDIKTKYEKYEKVDDIESLVKKQKDGLLYVSIGKQGISKKYKKVENLAGLAEGQKNELYEKKADVNKGWYDEYCENVMEDLLS
jgi:small GTP-binding protein